MKTSNVVAVSLMCVLLGICLKIVVGELPNNPSVSSHVLGNKKVKKDIHTNSVRLVGPSLVVSQKVQGTSYWVDGVKQVGWFSNNVTPRVMFSPNYGGEDCEANIVREIGNATNSIYVSTYQFTLPSVSEALIKAKGRGVDVRMIIDPTATNTRNQRVSICASNGIPVFVDSKHSIFHNKLMVIDAKTVITGSFNFTINAEHHNAENMWIIIDKPSAVACMSDWVIHASHSVSMSK